MATVIVPSVLRSHSNFQSQITIERTNLRDCLVELCRQYEGMTPYIFNTEHALNPYINIYKNGQDTRRLDPLQIQLQPNDQITILLALAGG